MEKENVEVNFVLQFLEEEFGSGAVFLFMDKLEENNENSGEET